MSETIKVVVRVRPMNTRQNQRGCLPITMPDQQSNQISIKKPDEQENIKTFAFDSVFGESSTQDVVYEKTAFKLVESVIEGYNGTVFAYGQTGCGKTHSMVGKLDDPILHGIIPRSFKHILNVVAEAQNKQFLIRCSFIQIYNQQVHDLLSKDVKAKLDVKQSTEKGIFIKDLSMNPAKTYDELMTFMNVGNKNRSVGQTLMNKDSSRSHSIFMLFIESAEKTTGQDQRFVAGKLNLVDLAGSQRISKTGAAGDRLKEAQKINLSLSALGNVISALVDGKTQHIPYRDSKLTRLLQDSLGGNTKTVMIANCSPADYNFDETLSTLRYASRAKFIKNKPIINEDPKDALLKQYAQQIKRLKALLEGGQVKLPPQPTLKEQASTDKSERPQKSQESDFKNQLREKQRQLDQQKDERKKLEERIKALESQHLEAKDLNVQSTQIQKIHKIRESLMRNVVPVIKVSEDQMVAGGQRQDELEHYKKLVKKQRQKIKALEVDLKDINYENYKEKEELLDEVRDLTRETKLQAGLLNMLLSKEELEILKSACQYREDNQDYKIPACYIRNKKLVFPKVGQNQSIDLIREVKQSRQIVIEKKQESAANTSILKNADKENADYRLNEVIKIAKVNNADKKISMLTPSIQKKEKQAFTNASLEPIEQRPVIEQQTVEPKLQRKNQLSPIVKR